MGNYRYWNYVPEDEKIPIKGSEIKERWKNGWHTVIVVKDGNYDHQVENIDELEDERSYLVYVKEGYIDNDKSLFAEIFIYEYDNEDLGNLRDLIKQKQEEIERLVTVKDKLVDRYDKLVEVESDRLEAKYKDCFIRDIPTNTYMKVNMASVEGDKGTLYGHGIRKVNGDQEVLVSKNLYVTFSYGNVNRDTLTIDGISIISKDQFNGEIYGTEGLVNGMVED